MADSASKDVKSPHTLQTTTPSLVVSSPGTGLQPVASLSVAGLRLQPGSTTLGAARSSRTPKHPGYNMFDWNRLSQSGKDLTGIGGKQLVVSLGELAKHKAEDDVWTAYRGKVYNVTAFLRYHPGGKKQVMRGAGKDCTALFEKVHAWVNVDSILQSCLVGVLDSSSRTSLGAWKLDAPNQYTRESSSDSEVAVTLTVPQLTSGGVETEL